MCHLLVRDRDWPPREAVTQNFLVVQYIEGIGKAKGPPSMVCTCIVGYCYLSTTAALSVAVANFGGSILGRGLSLVGKHGTRIPHTSKLAGTRT